MVKSVRVLLLCSVLAAGCGYPPLEAVKREDAATSADAAADHDAGTPVIDAGAPSDATVSPIDGPATLSCGDYCTTIQANCTGTNAQYPDVTHCMAACGSFAVGAFADIAGNTLGCRNYYAGVPAMQEPTTHCPQAGPGGDLTNAAAPGVCGDACTSFCTLEIKACGVTGDGGANGQYTSQAACVTACAGFPNKNNLYSPTSHGDSLACRLYHATNAAISGQAATHCPHTGPAPAGAANPCLAGSPASP